MLLTASAAPVTFVSSVFSVELLLASPRPDGLSSLRLFAPTAMGKDRSSKLCRRCVHQFEVSVASTFASTATKCKFCRHWMRDDSCRKSA